MRIQTNYAGHDRQYRLRRERGQSGWDTDEAVAATLAELERELDSPYLPKSGRVLEMGCGAGDLSLFLASRGYSVTGVDISPFAIAWAQEKATLSGIPLSSASFHVGDVCELVGFEADSFDMVLDGQCLHCIIGGDRARFLNSAYLVLRPGGVLHIRTMCGEPKSSGMREGFDAVTRCQIRGGIALRYVGRPETIVQEVKEAGFTILADRIQPTKDEEMLMLDATKEYKDAP